jgi:hypothetical protein
VLLRYANSGGYVTNNKRQFRQSPDDCRLRTLVNSTSTAPLIGLLLKGDKFYHTSNTLLVGPQRRHALLQLNFNSSAVSQLLVVGCWSLVIGH